MDLDSTPFIAIGNDELPPDTTMDEFAAALKAFFADPPTYEPDKGFSAHLSDIILRNRQQADQD